MKAYYNENDPKAAAWLRELIKAGHIAPGYVDERSITEISPYDLTEYTQCHFFAGIGGWSLALRLAGWPDDRPVWTGSCPCQPFSAAGKQLGTADERHLWPVFHRLIAQCRPSDIFGEQVASKAGRDWLAGVRADLEGVGYAVGAADLCAAGTSPEVAGWIWIPDELEEAGGTWIPASAGAPHIRQRLYWVAYAHGSRSLPSTHAGVHRGEEGTGTRDGQSQRRGAIGGMAHADSGQRNGFADGEGCQRNGQTPGRQQGNGEPECGSAIGGLADSDGGDASAEREQRGGEQRQQPEDGGAGGMADAGSARGQVGLSESPQREEGDPDQSFYGSGGSGFWTTFDLLPCTDGKARRVEPGSFPLASGVPGRVGLLRGYGNAIVPQVAAEFIRACEEAHPLTGQGKEMNL